VIVKGRGVLDLSGVIATRFEDPITTPISTFLISIGIPVLARDLDETTFFPGMKIECGSIVVDESKLKHPGDILHEAGHLAVVSADQRAVMNGDVGFHGGPEMQALACIRRGDSFEARSGRRVS
jgi:hypothetical protein